MKWALLLALCWVTSLAVANEGVIRDVPYGPTPAQRMDVYLPPHANSAPILLMVHGGGWMLGDKAARNVVANKVSHWVPRGFVFISINNRLLPAADPLQQAADVARALAFTQANAKSWGGDASRVVLMGHSAGAHLVDLLAADPALGLEAGVRPWLGTISLDTAAVDVTAIMQGPHFPLYDRAFGNDRSYWQRASPMQRLKGMPRPMLMVCSTLRANSCPASREFVAKVGSNGGKATLLPVALSHEQINESLGLPGAYTDAVDSFLQSLGLP